MTRLILTILAIISASIHILGGVSRTGLPDLHLQTAHHDFHHHNSPAGKGSTREEIQVPHYSGSGLLNNWRHLSNAAGGLIHRWFS